jgi:hypothetical protein
VINGLLQQSHAQQLCVVLLCAPCNTVSHTFFFFCCMQTLMDPDRRATYDALAGFSASSINPFADVSLPADQVGEAAVTCSSHMQFPLHHKDQSSRGRRSFQCQRPVQLRWLLCLQRTAVSHAAAAAAALLMPGEDPEAQYCSSHGTSTCIQQHHVPVVCCGRLAAAVVGLMQLTNAAAAMHCKPHSTLTCPEAV